jgi:hypothetical protein
MIQKTITLPELALVAGTRVALGAGLGLLLAGCLNDDQRRAAGWALFAIGALSSIPLAIEVLGRHEPAYAAHRDRSLGDAERVFEPAHA